MTTRHAILAAMTCFCGVAFAQSDKTDMKFATTAAQGGMAEVAVGQVASSKAASADVKQFAQRMVTDHTKANQELNQTASKSGVTLPQGVAKEDKAKADRLTRLEGAAFDKAYMKMMVEDHEKTVALFEKEANSGSDPDMKAFAQKTLPTLKEHLEMARSVERNASASSKPESD